MDFSGETRFYTRFDAAQSEEGDHSQVEMKNSSDTEDELGVSVGEHPQDTYDSRQRCSLKCAFFLAFCTLFVFVMGYLLGYVTSPKPAVMEPTRSPEIDDEMLFEPEPTLDWVGVQKLLGQKLSAASFENCLREFSSQSHEAGSKGDEELAAQILSEFLNLGMNPWTDEHYVKLQVANAARFGAAAVLIYPDPVDVVCNSDCELFGHVSMDTLKSVLRKMSDRSFSP
ncbi:hypothetical protein Z043_125177 [Scleropages formosus]|uniref:Transferrin receptor protein 1 n=1 Tax=Scleropages formosus TaxID=113540 RepID=A0A0N8JV47_SCLFO|nr:hypothetical protein Z043_125177 [Scleropages formosus]